MRMREQTDVNDYNSHLTETTTRRHENDRNITATATVTPAKLLQGVS